MTEELVVELRQALERIFRSERNVEIVMRCNGWDLGPGVSEAILAKEYGISRDRVHQIRCRAEHMLGSP
ncbi:hypothetical protein AC630_11800 [Bradyrhizobium sp. AS23.2]|nr:hypothetical protein AC630_11800 [Bradyrhizobium sp. AS23.2]